MFDRCPGVYLRPPTSHSPDGRPWRTHSVDGMRTAWEVAAEGHWRYCSGHTLGDPPPPKLQQAIWFIEREKRARDALREQARKERAEIQQKASDGQVIARRQ